MKYLVRLNSKALNPLTGKVLESKVWEVEQGSNKDSEKVIWHCSNVTIGDQDIKQVIGQRTVLDEETILKSVRSAGTVGPKFELTFHGIVLRGQDNAIVIKEGRHDVQS